jgi:hypothetical protein
VGHHDVVFHCLGDLNGVAVLAWATA